jgi:hypothetical protein
MAGFFYSRTTWLITIILMAATFCFQLGQQYGHSHNNSAAARLEDKLAKWDAKYHEDEAPDVSPMVVDHNEVTP